MHLRKFYLNIYKMCAQINICKRAISMIPIIFSLIFLSLESKLSLMTLTTAQYQFFVLILLSWSLNSVPLPFVSK